MGLAVDLEAGRTACAESIESFLRATDALSEHELLDASRCHGWSRLDVVVHVIAGWQEMLAGFVSPTDAEPSVDMATYWPAYAKQYASDDPVAPLMSQRRRTAAYARPATATAHLHEVGASVLRGVISCQGGALLWDGHVFAAGDFLGLWAVENVVHQLDLRSDEAAPSSALRLSRATIEALVEEPLPETWSDADATLIGTGRKPVPVGSGPVSARLPAFG